MIFTDSKKRKSYVIYSAIASLIFLTFPFVCQATPSLQDVVNGIVGFLAGLFVDALGKVSSLIISGIITVAPYNNFIKEDSISQAWSIIRDFSNMWFILILLVIAFATILRIETYNMKRWLPKLLVMAVLINFSKTICGVMIDFSQVIMLTFVNTFSQTGGQFVDVTKLKETIGAATASTTTMTASSTPSAGAAWTMGNVVVAYLLACVFMLVAVVTLLAILIVFFMRIIMLWILVALSPLAFMLSSFPQGAPYASRYWGEFTKYLINGPVLAFFIWLALSVMGNFNNSSLYDLIEKSNLTTGASSMMTSGVFIPFVMAIGFLVGGLMISQQIGGIGANWGMSAVRNLGNRGINTVRRAGSGAVRRVADLGIGTVSRQQWLRNGLASIAGAGGGQGALGGRAAGWVAGVTGARALSTAAYVGMGNRQRALEEQAGRYIGSINDTRILGRFVNQTGVGSVTPWAGAARDAAQNKAPDLFRNPDAARNHLLNMSQENLNRLSSRSITNLGRRNIDLGGFSEYNIRGNAQKLGWNNLGRLAGGHGGLEFINRDGTVAPGNYGYIPTDPTAVDNLLRTPPPAANRFRYLMNEVDEEGREKQGERGIGNLALGDFSRGKADTLAVDFDKLNIEKIKEETGKEYKDVRGVNTEDRNAITNISKRMVDILGQEIAKLKTKGNLSDGEKSKINVMEKARDRFREPEEIDHLSLVNSSAVGMIGARKIGETMMHEEIHGRGIKNETETENLTELLNTGFRASRKTRNKAIDAYAKTKERMGGESPLASKETIDKGGVEAPSVAPESPAREAGSNVSGEPMRVIIEEDNSTRNTADEVKTAPADIRNSVAQFANSPLADFRQFNYWLRQLNKSLIQQTDKMGKLSNNLRGLTSQAKEASPLEIKVIQNQMQKALGEQENI